MIPRVLIGFLVCAFLLSGLPAQEAPPVGGIARDVSVIAQEGADVEAGEECTVGVACGRATADGRPLLWKNRDAQKRATS